MKSEFVPVVTKVFDYGNKWIGSEPETFQSFMCNNNCLRTEHSKVMCSVSQAIPTLLYLIILEDGMYQIHVEVQLLTQDVSDSC